MVESEFILNGGLTTAVLYLVYDLRMRMIKLEAICNGGGSNTS